ncbi:MAG: hypothetical protein GX278_01220 [Aeromonadales bacterium]|nr:hypothetical protein [Aeromonadales bacterium]
MSIINNIQNKALDEEKQKAKSVNSYKFVTVRPSSSLAALIDVLAFLDGKSPTDFIYSNFGQALESFVLESKDHVIPLKKSVLNCYKKYNKTTFKEQSALGLLVKEGIIDCSFLNNLAPKNHNPKLLKKGFNKTVLDLL